MLRTPGRGEDKTDGGELLLGRAFGQQAVKPCDRRTFGELPFRLMSAPADLFDRVRRDPQHPLRSAFLLFILVVIFVLVEAQVFFEVLVLLSPDAVRHAEVCGTQPRGTLRLQDLVRSDGTTPARHADGRFFAFGTLVRTHDGYLRDGWTRDGMKAARPAPKPRRAAPSPHLQCRLSCDDHRRRKTRKDASEGALEGGSVSPPGRSGAIKNGRFRRAFRPGETFRRQSPVQMRWTRGAVLPAPLREVPDGTLERGERPLTRIVRADPVKAREERPRRLAVDLKREGVDLLVLQPIGQGQQAVFR